MFPVMSRNTFRANLTSVSVIQERATCFIMSYVTHKRSSLKKQNATDSFKHDLHILWHGTVVIITILFMFLSLFYQAELHQTVDFTRNNLISGKPVPRGLEILTNHLLHDYHRVENRILHVLIKLEFTLKWFYLGMSSFRPNYDE